VERSGDVWIVSSETETELEVETSGIRFLRSTGQGLKPTTYALQLLGQHIDKNVVEVNQEQFEMLLKREGMVDKQVDEEGYVALKFDDRIVGCGFYKDSVVSSRIPKGRSEQLLQSFQ